MNTDAARIEEGGMPEVEAIGLEELDDYDQARAADMDERPIYVTINVTVVQQSPDAAQEREEVAA